MDTLCWKCENLIARHGAAAHDLSEVAEALTHQAKTDCSAAERDAALAKVIVAEARCAGLRTMISAHLLEHTRTAIAASA
jgi:hypothetical protein